MEEKDSIRCQLKSFSVIELTQSVEHQCDQMLKLKVAQVFSKVAQKGARVDLTEE